MSVEVVSKTSSNEAGTAAHSTLSLIDNKALRDKVLGNAGGAGGRVVRSSLGTS